LAVDSEIDDLVKHCMDRNEPTLIHLKVVFLSQGAEGMFDRVTNGG